MTRCAAVRRKGATEQCTAAPIFGSTLCGRHVRSKHVVLWKDCHQHEGDRISKFQSLFRGWHVRKRLALAGPGVLRRRDLANDEDVVTCQEKERQHPFQYFGFVENDKTWWFDVNTLWKWSLRSVEPTNPYTKVPLTSDTRKRLRAIWGYKQRHRLPLPEEPTEYNERLRGRWNILCQIFADYGFGTFSADSFMRMSKAQYLAMFRMLGSDLEVVMKEKDPIRARALRYCVKGQTLSYALQSNQYIVQSVYTLLVLLTLPSDPYAMTFSVLSALYRC